MNIKMEDKDDRVTVSCPTCGAEVRWSKESVFRPFCSARCRDKDFIDWAEEENVISGNSTYDDLLSEDLPPRD